MSTTLYPRQGISAAGHPVGYQAAWTTTIAANGGSGAKIMTTVPGSGQISSGFSSSGAAGTNAGCLQTCSYGLATQGTVAASNWSIGFATDISAVGSLSHNGQVAIYLMNSLNSIKTTILALTSIGAGNTSNAERTAFNASVACASFSPSANDYLLVEWGVINNSASGTTLAVFTDGTTAITADVTATADAQSFVTCPTTLLFLPLTLSPSAGFANFGGTWRPKPVIYLPTYGRSLFGSTLRPRATFASLGTGAGLFGATLRPRATFATLTAGSGRFGSTLRPQAISLAPSYGRALFGSAIALSVRLTPTAGAGRFGATLRPKAMVYTTVSGGVGLFGATMRLPVVAFVPSFLVLGEALDGSLLTAASTAGTVTLAEAGASTLVLQVDAASQLTLDEALVGDAS